MIGTVARSVLSYLFVGCAIYIVVLSIYDLKLLLDYFSINEVLKSALMVDLVVRFVASIGLFLFGLGALRNREHSGDKKEAVSGRMLWIQLSVIVVLMCLAFIIVAIFSW